MRLTTKQMLQFTTKLKLLNRKSYVDWITTEIEGSEMYCRCFAKFVEIHGLSEKNPITVETKAGILKLYNHDSGNDVSVNLGRPDFRVAHIPILNRSQADEFEIKFDEDDETVKFVSLSVGNPHAVIQVPDVNSAPLNRWGELFNLAKGVFPIGVNVEVVKIISASHLKVFRF